jgi:hypothetical protein
MNTCQFHPEGTMAICGKPASRQVFFPSDQHEKGGGYYMYICDECLPGAVVYWNEGGFKVEF